MLCNKALEMTATARPMSADDLWKLPADDLRHELVRGELRTMAPAGFRCGVVGTNLAVTLANHVKAHRLGAVVGADTGFVLNRNPDTLRAPDVGFVCAKRITSQEQTIKFWEGPPDLAVEVVSPSDTLDEIDEKVDDYLESGTRLIWVVNPRRQTVTVCRPGQQPLLLRDADTLEGYDVVGGFACRVGEIFS
jgi:Uma2 family endonuclease